MQEDLPITDNPQRSAALKAELRITAIYLVFGALWIILSDRLLYALVADPRLQAAIQTYKGWTFVAGTALLYYLLLRAENSRRRKAEEGLRLLNLELEKRVKERTEELEAFSYSVSHDLRAPLRGIDGFSKILLEDHGPELGPEALRAIGVIRQSTDKMDKLICALLAFSRLSSAGMAAGRVDMNALAREAWAEAVQSCARAPRFELAPLPPALGDGALLKQVWANLFSNAVKFSAGAAAPEVSVTARPAGGLTEYSVRDNGAGFEPRRARELFGLFQRLHSETEFEGTGIGLAIARRIVARHGGGMRADGAPGKGAEFSFTLPPPDKG